MNGAAGWEAMTNNAQLGVDQGGKGAENDWLSEIFQRVEEGIPDMAMSLSAEEIAALEEVTAGVKDEEPSENFIGVSNGGKRGRGEGGEEQAKQKKSKREKLRREALNDRFMQLSALLDPSKPPKTDKATIVTEAAQVISRLRKELATLSATLEGLQKDNVTLQEEKMGLLADKETVMQEKAALQQDKQKLENQLHCFMSSMPFASPQPGLTFSMPPFQMGPHGVMMAHGQPNPQMKVATPNQNGSMPPIMWSIPRLVVQSTTAEEDAKLRAPVA